MALSIVILAAGAGTRMKSQTPKVLHPVGGLPMLGHVLRTAEALNPEKIVLVLAADDLRVIEALPTLSSGKIPVEIAFQEQPLGTAHAVLSAEPFLALKEGSDCLVLYGDTPTVTPSALQELLKRKAEAPAASVGIVAVEPENPKFYGRIISTHHHKVLAIIEASEATPEQLQIRLCNSGVVLASAKELFSLLHKVTPTPPKNEYYLTDIIQLANSTGIRCYYVTEDAENFCGVNNNTERALAERILQTRWRQAAMEKGVTLIDPNSVYFSYDTQLSKEVVVYPHVYFGLGVTVEDSVTIRPYCMLQHCTLKKNVTIGPFAHLRPGTVIEEGGRVGNFVEVKNSTLGAKSHADHLSYIGDAVVGEGAQIGAGTITCNYNGFEKSKTTIGKNAFIGSHSTLVAPLTIGEGALTAAGSVITKDVEANALAFARAKQTQFPHQAEKFRERAAAQREKKRVASESSSDSKKNIL